MVEVPRLNSLELRMKQDRGLKRNPIDKFYTKYSVVQLCCDAIKKHLDISYQDLIIEPSAGNGSFIPMIKSLVKNYLFFDIEPEDKEIIKQDYLNLVYSKFIHKDYKIHIIGNPPFGRQSSMAIKFIKKSSQFGDSISFILPKSFKKESLKRKFPLNFHLIFEMDLPENSFINNNLEYNIPTIFQIWIKKNVNREINIKLEPVGFIFVKKECDPDISFRRVGVNAGFIDKNINNKSIQSHYFIKFTNNLDVHRNIKTLENIKFQCNNVVGPKSISKQELIKNFNDVLNE